MITVIIVDDHEIMRLGIKKLLEDQSDIKVIGDAESGEQLMKMLRQQKPNVVLMDVKMPGIGGLETIRRIQTFDASVKVIALTSVAEEPIPSRVIEAGALGYLTKGSGLDEIVSAIHRVHQGKTYLSHDIAKAMALKNLPKNKASPFESLSERELQVMLMITNGEHVQQISEKLCISAKTVNSYRYRLFEKLNVSNDVELTHLAIQYDMVDKLFNSADSSKENEHEDQN